MPQTESLAAYLADEADDLHRDWTSIANKYGLTGKDDVTCALTRQRAHSNSLNQKATEELAIVTALRRGLTSPSSRRQISAICRTDTAIAS